MRESLGPPTVAEPHNPLLDELTPIQREAVLHEQGPLLIIAGAGTGKTTVITRRIAWLLMTKRVRAEEILALTFTEKAAAEMEERVDLLVPYGYLDVSIRTFHAFGDQLLREHALKVGLTPQFRVFSKAEQLVFLRQHIFDLPLHEFRPLHDPTRFVEALAAVFARANDEAVSPEEFVAYAEQLHQQALANPEDESSVAHARRTQEIAQSYAVYHRLLRDADAVDFGDQVSLAIRLLERHPDVLATLRARYRYLLVDEFQDTNYAQFRLLQLFAPPGANITVVADDDQSIYKWRGAAISNVVKFLEYYASVRTVVLTENFRSTQAILNCAYRLIRFNDPDRLEVKQGVDKKLIARANLPNEEPHLHVFDTVSSEADWVARTIRDAVESGLRRPNEIAILVRSNREADIFLRALNVVGIPWRFSGASGLFARAEAKLFVSCLKTLADPEDSLSWYHVASSSLYACPMSDVALVVAHADRTNQSVRTVIERFDQEAPLNTLISEEGKQRLTALRDDVKRLLELSRSRSAGQLLYQWLQDRGWIAQLSRGERAEESAQLQTAARFFTELQRIEALIGTSLPVLMQHLELFQAIGNEPHDEEDAWSDRVNVLTLHKAKGLEFPTVFLVGLVQGRFPTPRRRDAIEFPDALIKDLLPAGDYHLQEERRLFYVGMTRAKQELHFTLAYDYGGKTVRKVSQFVLEALELASPSPPAKVASARELMERSAVRDPLPLTPQAQQRKPLRLDPHGVDDYLTCPLKYRYSHVLKIPVMRHHLVVYGAALHKAVEAFFTQRLRGVEMPEDELLHVFEQHWSSEGFLTRGHEELRLNQGREVLKRFYARQQSQPERPALIEEKFKVLIDDLVVVGRWDRVDQQETGATIIDYKSSDVRDQKEADRRTRESIQMLLYALAWHVLHGQPPLSVELRFLESGVSGQTQFTLDDFTRAQSLLQQAASGIRAREFSAKPQEHACRWCAFQAICPFAFQSHVS